MDEGLKEVGIDQPSAIRACCPNRVIWARLRFQGVHKHTIWLRFQAMKVGPIEQETVSLTSLAGNSAINKD